MAGQLQVLNTLEVAKTQWYHFTAIIIAGMGFFTDAYSLFCTSLVTKLLGCIYYHVDGAAKPGTLPPNVSAAVNGVAFCGSPAGQLFFGGLGDKLGRKKVYGMTLIVMVICSIASAIPFGHTPKPVVATLCFFWFWLGFGIGGDFPLSATIMSEYANKKRCGAFIAAVFAMQGFGILAGGIFAIIISSAFKARFDAPPCEVDPSGSIVPQADKVWCIVLMVGSLPALLTYYWWMKMPETARYTALVAKDAKQAASDKFGLFSKEFLRCHGLHFLDTTTTWFAIQLMGFFFMTVFMFGLAIPYDHWTHKDDRIAFMAMCLLTFFFTNFAPNAATFVVLSSAISPLPVVTALQSHQGLLSRLCNLSTAYHQCFVISPFTMERERMAKLSKSAAALLVALLALSSTPLAEARVSHFFTINGINRQRQSILADTLISHEQSVGHRRSLKPDPPSYGSSPNLPLNPSPHDCNQPTGRQFQNASGEAFLGNSSLCANADRLTPYNLSSSSSKSNKINIRIPIAVLIPICALLVLMSIAVMILMLCGYNKRRDGEAKSGKSFESLDPPCVVAQELVAKPQAYLAEPLETKTISKLTGHQK